MRERERQIGSQARTSGHSGADPEADGAIAWVLVAAFLLSALAMVWLAAEYISD